MKLFLFIGMLISGLFQQAPAAEIQLDSVNGITLYDDTDSLIRKMGPPIQVAKDPLFEDEVTYTYPDMQVTFIDGIVDYIEIGPGTEVILLDQTKLPPTKEAIQAILGEPNYKVEDGWVYQRNDALLKLFIHADSGQLHSITYYHIASV